MRADSEILADLDFLRDSRHTISEEEYHLAWDRLWDELRAHDRAKTEEALEKERQQREEERRKEEEALADRRKKRLSQAQRRLDRWFAQPTPTTAAELRSKLEEFVRIPASNNPDLRNRQGRIKARLARPQPAVCSQEYGGSLRRTFSKEEGFRRRAEKTKDMDKALKIARRYHIFVKRLYLSRHAEIEYGKGGHEQVVWRHRNSRYPTVWKNAGVWIDYSTDSPTVVFEDYRGRLVCCLQIPLERVTFEGLVDGDLWGILHGSRVERWAMGELLPVVSGYTRPGPA
jgi:hypothetical protein